MEKEQFFLKRIRELANISYQRDIVTFSDFLNLNEQNLISTLNFKELGVMTESFGGYDHAERQMMAFHPFAVAFSWEYPIDCLKIEPKAMKFSDVLSHRDYLGALLNLGVDRSTIGDILIRDQTAWLFCQRKLTSFFLENLTRVKHTVVLTSVVDRVEELPGPNLAPVTGTCSSIRLDSLIAIAFQASRNSMVPCIEGGLVFVNGKLITSNGYEPKEGDIISVRGKGRFLFDGITGQTKKGRIGVRLMRYV